MKYVLDSNVFIQAKNQYYTFDLCPGFWKWLESFSISNSVLSVEGVREELAAGSDELAEWAKRLDKKHFIPHGIEVQSEYRKIVNHVNDKYKKQEHVSAFLSKADPWLIASAMYKNLTIVTHEQPSPNSHKIKIPNICKHFNVPFIDTFELLIKEKVTFILHE